MPYFVPDRVERPLHVVVPVFNPIRYKARWKLFERFAKSAADAGATLHTIEAAFGERTPAIREVAERYGTYQLVRTSSELWLKENLINLAVARIADTDPDWRYVAWVDGDVEFSRSNWVGMTLHALQHYRVVQMWSEAIDLGPDHEPIQRHLSFAYCQLNQDRLPAAVAAGTPQPGTDGANGIAYGGAYGYYTSGGDTTTPRTLGTAGAPMPVHFWHPGYAWAYRRETLEQLGGLLDVAVTGAADNHMAKALVGRALDSAHPGVSAGYKQALLDWQARADRYVTRDLGYVPGTLLHQWHGSKKARQYWSRWRILVDTQFDPRVDLKRDVYGVWQLTERSPELRDKLRAYFRQRNEDGTDLDPSDVRM